MPGKPTTIDEFLARLSADKRTALEKLRRDIRTAAPGVEEVISYGTAGFTLDGRLLVWFGAGASHCSFYPGPLPIAQLASELADYETSKGTVRFAPAAPLPTALVAKLVRVRVAENAARAAAAKGGKRPARGAAKGSSVKGSSAKRSTTKRSTAKRSTTTRSTTKRSTTQALSAKPTAAKRAATKRAPATGALAKRTSAKRGR